MKRRASYDDVVVTTPVTIPYVRFSIRAAHWWIGRALGELVKHSGIAKERIDGFCVSSFTLMPDGAWVLTALDGGEARLAELGVPFGGR